jgi:two-component system, NtrC family, sensor kinase
MMTIAWNAHFTTDIQAIDRQHQGLLDKLNEVAPVLARYGDQPVEDFTALHEWLSGYASEHFATEEDLMERFRVDPRVAEPHRQSHQGFVDHLRDLSCCTVENDRVTGNDLLSFLAGWLVGHILGEDQALARQLHALESGLSSDRAYREAGGYRTNPSIEAVTDILVQVYGQLLRGAHASNGPIGKEPRANLLSTKNQ